MPREAQPSINERDFILQALSENTRLDSRALDAYRNLDITFGDEYGNADVQLGQTRVLTKISASLASPFPDRKFDGIFTITAELSPLASPAFEVGRPSDLEIHLTTTLDTLLRRSSALSTESLCLIAGQRVWHVRATLHVLSHSGSLLTCASISLLAALLHFRIPASEVKGGELTVYNTVERDPVPLALLHHPLCMTLGFFQLVESRAEEEGEGRVGVIADPTLAEEQVCAGEMIVGANKEGEVVLVEKNGGVEVGGLRVLQCVGLGGRIVNEIVKAVFDAVERDAKQRDRGGVMSRELRAENDR
ncbi:uncharacterized protein KY384_003133 [Bacidia gigantensis]|uniref:uncharacterized protein n=1 Tax=Bacidia gigantensis TaxID=2732470 RepID=UPI001D03E409|nr:uncharacterized protein KY384_003133 [Bacidia gigantensis]KAG8531504.1 hypothetical protein KY384_003133 [Bacidia gigantensis]